MKIKNYKNNKYLLFLIFILFLSILIYFLIKNWNNEDFQNNHKNIYTNFIIEQLNNITFTPILNLKFSLLHETKIKNKCCKSDKTGRQI